MEYVRARILPGSPSGVSRRSSATTAATETEMRSSGNTLQAKQTESGANEAEAGKMVWKDLVYIRDPPKVLKNRHESEAGKRIWKDLVYVRDPSITLDNGHEFAAGKTMWKDLVYIRNQPETLQTIWRDLNYISELKDTRTNDTSSVEKAVEEAEVAVDEQSVPWYLKDTYVNKSALIPEREPLPTLPENPPALLGEIIEHLDTQLGVTDMKIMDLRSLIPAPALGNEIIMVFGNTRSERHLHVTADKICRYLRSNHGIRPYADGLIGRNAQKLINRRRIRRGKVAASQLGEKDELVATEWVCVNTGYEGVILQLFTPRRREELNLEALWERKLDTSRKNMEKMANAMAQGKQVMLEELYDDEEEAPVEYAIEEMNDEEAIVNESSSSPSIFPIGPLSSFPKHQTRALHTTRTLCSQGFRVTGLSNTSVRSSYQKLPTTYQDFIRQVPFLSADIQNGAYNTIERSFNTFYPGRNFPQAMKQAGILYAHVHHLQNFPHKKACETLGETAFDTTSTPFLRSFFQEMPAVLEHIHYHAWLSLLIQGHTLKPSAYPESCFQEFITQMKASGMNVPVPFYTAILEVLATTSELRKNPEGSSTYIKTRETTRRMEEMVKILSDMSRSSFHDIKTPEIYSLITRGLMSKDIEGIHKIAMEVCELPTAAKHTRGALQHARKEYAPDRRLFLIERLMDHFQIKQDKPEWYTQFLTAAAIAGYWPAFWNRWNDIHFHGASRGRQMYKLVLGLVSMSENQIEAVNTLRNLQYSMSKEQPMIVLDLELARGFLAVMDVAGGRAGRAGIGAEYRSLRRQCESYLQPGAVSL